MSASEKPVTQTNQPHYLPVREEWLALYDEPALEPDLPIIDPHHHLWERSDWVYMLPDLLADTNSGHNIIGTVFVQCRQSLFEAGRNSRNSQAFFRRQVVQVLVRRIARVQLVLDTVDTGHQHGGKGQVGVGRGVGEANLYALATGAGLVGNTYRR